MEAQTKMHAVVAAMPKTVPVRTFCRMAEPTNRPTIAPPIIRNVACGNQDRNVADVGLAEIVDQKTADRYFCSHIDENSHHPQNQIAMLPYAGLRTGCAVTFGLRHGWQFEQSNGNPEHEQSEADHEVRQLDGGGLVNPKRLERLGRHQPHALHAQRSGG